MAGTLNTRRCGLTLPFKSRNKELNPRPRRPQFSTGVYQATTTPTLEEQSARLLPTPGERDGGQSNIKNGVNYININDDEQAEVYGYQRSVAKTFTTWVFIVATGGLLRLVFHWLPELMLKSTHSLCPLHTATKILIVEYFKKYKRTFVKNISEIHASNIRYGPQYSVLHGGARSGRQASRGEEGGQPMDDLRRPTTLPVPTPNGTIKEMTDIRVFRCRKILYIWDAETESFYRLRGQDVGQTGESLHQHRGLGWLEQTRRRQIYGENAIKVKITPIHQLLFLEALNPFYIFQLFSVILWYCDEYMYYATVIVVTSVVSLISEVYQMHRNEVALSRTIQSTDSVQVIREGGEKESIPSEHLVPGDVVVIPPEGCVMQCDAVLLQGTCIVNESMLTGESVPVTKTAMVDRSDIAYSEREHSRHTLFCGTQVIQTRYYGGERVLAVVVRCGFLTSKGGLVRSIMYPPPVDFKFQQDSYKFIGVLAGIASIGFVYTVVTKFMRGVTASDIALDSFDLITIVIPPALPMAMTVGILYALQRLKSKNIFCISPRSINISGVLNCICFDKTGTLTEDGLDMRGVIGVMDDDGGSGDDSTRLAQMTQPAKLRHDHLLFAMATCHTITKINMKQVGDPLDLRMFESTGWVLEEPGLEDTNRYDMMMPSVVRPSAPDVVTSNENVETEPPLELGILRQFPFSSRLQRMSVITRRLGAANFELYCKGSPEMIASLSKPETVPSDFTERLLGETAEGYRVLALAWRPLKLSYLKAQRISREEVECQLEFLGLLVLENRLKKESEEVIAELHAANIRTVMVTGDNMLTALSVGRKCGLVSQHGPVITVTATTPQHGQKPILQFHSTPASTPASMTTDKDTTIVELNRDTPYCLALEGRSWSMVHQHFPDLLTKIVVRGAVFARMSPDQKQQLVLELQSLGYFVGMCGDGANDCGALKAANAGISLSEAEASVASPFTSGTPNISCVPRLIREGRCALVTSFGIFKYMAGYSLTQFVSIMILYSIDSNLTDFQFLWIDLFLITVFAIFFGRTQSYEGPLAAYSPPASLLSVAPILSILLHIALVIGFQTFCFFYVQEQSWFVPFNATTSDDILAGHENYAVFSISQFQYITLAVVFSRGPPFRQHIYTNALLLASFVITTALSILLTVAPPQFIIDQFELVMPPEDDPKANFFRWQIFLLSLFYTILAVIVEYLIIDYLFYQKCKQKLHNVDKSKKKYLAIERDLQADKTWPPIALVDETGGADRNELMLDPRRLDEPGTEVNGHVQPVHKTTVTQFQSSL